MFEEMLDENNIRMAIRFSLDQIKNEVYYNPVQYDDFKSNTDMYVKKIQKRLINYKNFKTNLAMRAIKHKNEFAIRNMIILDMEDVVIRTVYGLILANHLESKLINNCFSSKRGEQISKNEKLFEDFATCGWHNFCEWQGNSVNKYKYLLKTDISSFFDSISHEYIISALENEFCLTSTSPEILLMRKILKVRHTLFEGDKPEEIKHGITIGTFSNHVLANLLLNNIDHYMNDLRGISYGRYVDDIRIFSNNYSAVSAALKLLQLMLYDIGLNLNGAKTNFAGSHKLFEKMKSIDVVHYINQEEDIEKLFSELEADINLQIAYKESIRENLDTPFNATIPERCLDKKSLCLKDDRDVTEFLHRLNRLLNNYPSKIRRKDVLLLLRIVSKNYKNEKFAIWLISSIIIKPIFSIKNREFVLTKVLNMIIKGHLTFYAMSRFFILMASRDRFKFWPYAELDEYLEHKQHKKLVKALAVLQKEKTLYSNMVIEYFLKNFNNHSHSKQISVTDLESSMCKSFNCKF